MNMCCMIILQFSLDQLALDLASDKGIVNDYIFREFLQDKNV